MILSSLCACCTPAVLRFSRIICTKVLLLAVAELRIPRARRSTRRSHPRPARDAAKALDGERAGDADLLLILVGLVVEVFELGLGGDGGVDLLLAGDALLPPVGVQLLRRIGPLGIGLARNLPLFPGLA